MVAYWLCHSVSAFNVALLVVTLSTFYGGILVVAIGIGFLWWCTSSDIVCRLSMVVYY